MPINTSLTINDGIGNVVFTLDSVMEKSGVVTRKYINRSAATPLAAESISFAWRSGGSNETGASSCAISLEVPTALAATATTAASVSHTCRFANGKFYLPNRSTVAERTRLANLSKNAVAHADVQNMMILNEPLRG